jgi:FO synthase
MLINKNIPRTAGASHGQEVLPEDLEGIIREIERTPYRRTTLYEMPECEYSQSR